MPLALTRQNAQGGSRSSTSLHTRAPSACSHSRALSDGYTNSRRLERLDHVGVELAVPGPLPLVQCSPGRGDPHPIDGPSARCSLIADILAWPFLDERAPLVVAQPIPGSLADPPIDAVLALEAFVARGVGLR